MRDIEKARRLVEHRELQLLRASAVRTKGGRGWVRVRAAKLREAREYLERLQRREQAKPEAPESAKRSLDQDSTQAKPEAS